MARIVAVANQKGGVGKTTTVFNIGAIAADMGRKTLLVDLDPQAALTASLGLDPHRLKKSIYHLLLAKELDPEKALARDVRPNLDILPANKSLVRSDVELAQQIGREYLLQESLFPIRHEYDLILIDNGPSLGVLTVNALTAANEVLIPLVCEYLALRGMSMLVDMIRQIRSLLHEQGYTINGARQKLSGEEAEVDSTQANQLTRQMIAELEDVLKILR